MCCKDWETVHAEGHFALNNRQDLDHGNKEIINGQTGKQRNKKGRSKKRIK
jgi:hypothetical protein